MLSLPPVVCIPPLNDEVSGRMWTRDPGCLPRSLDKCHTCRGRKTFTWLADPERQIVPTVRHIPKINDPKEYDTIIEVTDLPEFAEYECPCHDQFRLQAYLLAHNLGPKQARMSWGDGTWIAPGVKAQIQAYADNCESWSTQGTGLYLYSPTGGNGKSLAAVMVLKAFMAAGIEGYWTTFNEMLALHSSGWRDKEARDWFETHVRNALVLVIDDLGKEASLVAYDKDNNQVSSNRGAVVNEQLDEVFRSRSQKGKITIFTSNLDFEDVGRHYTAALGSLVTESCMPVAFPEGDVRKLHVARVQAEVANRLTRPFTLR